MATPVYGKNNRLVWGYGNAVAVMRKLGPLNGRRRCALLVVVRNGVGWPQSHRTPLTSRMASPGSRNQPRPRWHSRSARRGVWLQSVSARSPTIEGPHPATTRQSHTRRGTRIT
jgi:hypothetical protein